MAAQLRSDSLHPCHHLSEPLRNMFWCRHCMKIFTDPIDRWRHSKICREATQTGEEANQSKQMSLKEGTLLRFGVWESDTVVSRPTGPDSKHTSQYGIRISGTGKVANHKGPVTPQNFDLQCVICKTPFKSIDEMRNHVKTPCSKSSDGQSTNRFPSEITNVQPPQEEEMPQEDVVNENNLTPNHPTSETLVRYIFSEDNDIRSDSPTLIGGNEEKIVLLGNWDEIDGLPFKINTPEDLNTTVELEENRVSTQEENCTPAIENKAGVTDKVDGGDGLSLVKLDGKVPALEITKLMLPEILNYSKPVKCQLNSSIQFDKKKGDANSSPSPPKKQKMSDDKGSNSVNDHGTPYKTKKVGKSKSRKSKKQFSRKKSRNKPSKKQKVTDTNSSPVETSVEQTNERAITINKDNSARKDAITKPQRPRKCPACSRIFKTLELLQKHNRVPCRVKLTRNVTAKVLRSKSQSSDSGRILQRQGSSGAKPPQNKPLLKRRPKKAAKKTTPVYRVNMNLPQYRLVFESLDPKEQFFYKLAMVPVKSILVSIENPVTESSDLSQTLDIANPPSDEEPGQMPVLYQRYDENMLPPELEKVSPAEGETCTENLDFIEPPELDLMFPVPMVNFHDMNSDKNKCAIKRECDSNSEHARKDRKQKPKCHKSRYSILDPITSSAKKKVKQNPNQNSVASRTSQRLKAKAMAKVSEENTKNDQKEKQTTPSAVSSKDLESRSRHDADLTNTASSSNNPYTKIIKRETTPCNDSVRNSTKSQKTTSPTRNLFETFHDSVQELNNKETALLENQNNVMNKMLEVKPHIDNTIKPKKSPSKKKDIKKVSKKADSSQVKQSKNCEENSPNIRSYDKDSNLETKDQSTTPPNVLARIRLPLLASRGSPRGSSFGNDSVAQTKIKMVTNARRGNITPRANAAKGPISQSILKTDVNKKESNQLPLQREVDLVLEAAKASVKDTKAIATPPSIISSVYVPCAKSLSNLKTITPSIVVSPRSDPVEDKAMKSVLISNPSNVSQKTFVTKPEKVTVQYINQTNTFPTLIDFSPSFLDETPVNVSQSALYLDNTSGVLTGDEAVPLDPGIDAIDPQFQAIQF